MQVAEGKHHKCRWSVCASRWNEKHHQRKLLKVRGTGHQHPSAQVGVGCGNNTTCTWAQLRCMLVPMCKLHVVAASRANLRRWMLVPGPPDLQQLALVVFSFQRLAQTLHLHLWCLPSATCAGGLFPSTTCAYSNLHCVVVVVVVVLYIWLWLIYIYTWYSHFTKVGCYAYVFL